MLKHCLSNPIDPRRVVVIGARGFIGRALMAGLARAGITALGLGSADLDLTMPDADQHLAALLEPGDAVVMLAAITPNKGRGVGAFMANLQMAAAVAAALDQVPPSQLVSFSSEAVYPMVEAPLNEPPLTETSRTEPTELFGMMHLAREMMFQTAVKAPVAILRPAQIYSTSDAVPGYGPNRLLRLAFQDRRITLSGDGEDRRDHIALDDVVALTVLALRHCSAGLANLATGRSISYVELAQRIAALFEPTIEVALTPRQVPATHRRFDVSGLRKAFPGFVPCELEAGIARAYEAMAAA
ncbi:MAG: NAD-dependent epimerase/dehydratase family protein [Candidatus Hydrogenedens sp.]|nr:NAD-dependent epimerase/dehydratase family protein [Candidatus Hydrogenedens sp.]